MDRKLQVMKNAEQVTQQKMAE